MVRRVLFLSFSVAVFVSCGQVKDPGWRVGEPSVSPTPSPVVSAQLLPPHTELGPAVTVPFSKSEGP